MKKNNIEWEKEKENLRKEEIRRWVKKSTYFGNLEEIVDWIYKYYPTDGYYQ